MATIINGRRHNDRHCNVITQNGRQYLVMPDGQMIPAQVWTRVTDPLEGSAYAIVKLYVNLGEELTIKE